MDIERILFKAIFMAVVGFLFMKTYKWLRPNIRDVDGFKILEPGAMHWGGLIGSCLLNAFLWVLFYNGFKKHGYSFFDLHDSNSFWFFIVFIVFNMIAIYFVWIVSKLYSQSLGWNNKLICYKFAGQRVVENVNCIELRSFNSNSPSKLYLQNGHVLRFDEYSRGFDEFFDYLLENHSQLQRALEENPE